MRLHEYLKKVAILWLLNRRCYIVGTEIYIPRSDINWREKKYSIMIQKHLYKQYIDACGIGIQYRSQWKREFTDDAHEHYKLVIVRGIEVKTSRSDYHNGFVQSGCNYNYLLTPKGLLKKAEVPLKVGLIEYEANKFSCIKGENNPFRFKGLRVVKKPKMQPVSEKDIIYITSEIGRKVTPILIESLFNKFNNIIFK